MNSKPVLVAANIPGFTQRHELMSITLRSNARIRECRPDDLAVVAALFKRIFRNGEKCNLATLESYLRDLFFEHPWRDPELTSRVSVAANGIVNGFVGVLPVRMTYRGTQVRAALACALMVDNPQQDPLAGARLLRSVLTGPQDLSLGETTNPLAQRMWQHLGGTAVPTYSMDWARILRPAQFGVAMLKAPPWMADLLRPVGSAVDALLGTAKSRRFRLEPNDAPITQTDLDANELVALIQRFAERYELRPAWDDSSLRWFLAHAARKGAFGDLIGRVVYGKNSTPLGCYLYYGRPGGMAIALQIFSEREHADTVVNGLLTDVNRRGCAAVRGRSQPDLLDALLQNNCIFGHTASLTMHSRNPELLAAIRAGGALVTGLAGESWAQLIRGQFV
jgi:hypothetical protein